MFQSHVQDATHGGISDSSTKGPRGSLEKLFRLTDEQKSLSTQAKWYVYSSCYVSKRTFYVAGSTSHQQQLHGIHAREVPQRDH